MLAWQPTIAIREGLERTIEHFRRRLEERSVGRGALAGGASKVIVADINPDKLKIARELGAHEAIDSSGEKALEQIRDLTGGGVDIGFEFAGVVPALAFTYNATARGGKTVTAGLPHPSKMLDLSVVKLVAEERTLQGSYIGSCIPSRDIPAYIDLYLSL